MSIHFLSKNLSQNETHSNELDKLTIPGIEPEIITLNESMTFIANGELDPRFIPCLKECPKCQKQEFDFINICILPIRWGSNFAHFLCETLPKILRVSLMNDKIPIGIYSNDAFEKVIKHLKIKNPIFSIGKYTVSDHHYHIKNCFTIGNYDNWCPVLSDLQLTRKQVEISTKGDLCLLIKRNKGDRVISNFDKLYYVLLNNFPNEKWVIYDENQPFEKYIKLFTNAKLIIGAHGAGISNIIFAPPNCTIIEVYPEDWIRHVFMCISKQLGFNHYLLSSQNTRNFKVDIDEILQLVFKIL
jgi:hypothetical protein